LNSKKPLLNLRFIVMKHNEHEVPNLADFARNLGADVATLRTLHPYDDDRLKDKTVSGDFVPGDKVYRRFSYDAETRSRIRRRHNPCKALWNNPSIHWNGAVCGCSFDPHDQYVLGNLESQSFREIWFGAPYRTFRRRFRRDYRQLALCKDCTYAFEGGACSTEDIIQTVHLREE
jgi:radical SAM protein with 4Fe4S-binding SPASM domain